MERIENNMVRDELWKPPYKVIFRCEECDRDICEGSEYFVFNNCVICEDCERDYVREHFRRCAE